MGIAALTTWLITATFGLYLFAVWLIEHDGSKSGGAASRLRAPIVFSHVTLAIGGLTVWVVYLFVDMPRLAWAAFFTLLPVALLGLTMLTRWIPVHRAATRASPRPGRPRRLGRSHHRRPSGTFPCRSSWCTASSRSSRSSLSRSSRSASASPDQPAGAAARAAGSMCGIRSPATGRPARAGLPGLGGVRPKVMDPAIAGLPGLGVRPSPCWPATGRPPATAAGLRLREAGWIQLRGLPASGYGQPGRRRLPGRCRTCPQGHTRRAAAGSRAAAGTARAALPG